MFKYCSEICNCFIKQVRFKVTNSENSILSFNQEVDKLVGRYLAHNEIPDTLALNILESIVQKEFDGLNLKTKDKVIICKIGKNKLARPKDYEAYGLKTLQDFSSNYLIRLTEQNLLLRRQEGRAVLYELRGLALLATEFNLVMREHELTKKQ